MQRTEVMTSGERKKANLRMALILASIAVTFFVGFIVKMTLFGHH